MEHIENILNDIILSVKNHDSIHLRENSIELAKLLLDYDNFPYQVFDSILNIMRQPEFLRMQGSHILLNNIFDDANILSNAQKKELVSVIGSIYDTLEDSTTCMFVLEMIVDSTMDKISIDSLRCLAKARNDVPRAIVAYGLYYFIQKCRNDVLIRSALDELQRMKNDYSKLVRDEVNDVLKKIGNRRVTTGRS